MATEECPFRSLNEISDPFSDSVIRTSELSAFGGSDSGASPLGDTPFAETGAP